MIAKIDNARKYIIIVLENGENVGLLELNINVICESLYQIPHNGRWKRRETFVKMFPILKLNLQNVWVVAIYNFVLASEDDWVRGVYDEEGSV